MRWFLVTTLLTMSVCEAANHTVNYVGDMVPHWRSFTSNSWQWDREVAGCEAGWQRRGTIGELLCTRGYATTAPLTLKFNIAAGCEDDNPNSGCGAYTSMPTKGAYQLFDPVLKKGTWWIELRASCDWCDNYTLAADSVSADGSRSLREITGGNLRFKGTGYLPVPTSYHHGEVTMGWCVTARADNGSGTWALQPGCPDFPPIEPSGSCYLSQYSGELNMGALPGGTVGVANGAAQIICSGLGSAGGGALVNFESNNGNGYVDLLPGPVRARLWVGDPGTSGETGAEVGLVDGANTVDFGVMADLPAEVTGIHTGNGVLTVSYH